MSFPKIDTCLICESARPELNNKHILLGFYGIAPYVRIVIRDFKQPILLCFVFSGGTGAAGSFTIGLRLSDPAGTVISNQQNAPDVTGNLVGGRTSTNAFMGFNGLPGIPGKYTVSLLVNGVIHFTTNFELVPAAGPEKSAFVN